MDELKYTVCVNCWTYNHSAWIQDAMNGFTMQETNFPFVCVIVDDCSTDGEQDIIKHYLQENFNLSNNSFAKSEEKPEYTLLFAQHNTNKNCFFAVFFLKYNHFQIKQSKKPYMDRWNTVSEYVAICEGDDYWIDSNKLQKQVDFLEGHPDHTLCIHAYRRDEYKGNEIASHEVYKYSNDVEIIPDEDVLNGTGMFGATASMVYKKSAVDNYPDWALKAPVGDRPLKFVLFARGHIAYINDVMSVYRVGVPGSWTVRVSRNRKVSRKTRKLFVKILVDFDEWTERKYHVLITHAISDYKKACRKNDLMYIVYLPFRQIKRLFHAQSKK